MFISSLFLIAALLLITIVNRRNRFTYIISTFLFSIAMLVVVCALYISKISTYYFPLKIDYNLFLLLSRVRIHIFYISRLYNISIGIYMAAAVIFCRMLLRMRHITFAVLLLPILYYLVINDPTTSWYLYIRLYATEGLTHALFQNLINLNYILYPLLVAFYILLPLAVLGRYYFATKLRIRRMHALVLAACFVLIDTFLYFIILHGFFSDVVTANESLTKLPDGNSLVRGYLTAPFLAIVLVCAIMFIMLYYKPFNYVALMRKRDAKRNAEILNRDSKMILHSYKNAFIGISRFTKTLEQSLTVKDPETVAVCNQQIRSIAEDCIANITRVTQLLKSTTISYENIRVYDCLQQAAQTAHIPKDIRFVLKNETQERYILGDKAQLIEVFNNLLQNAIQAVRKQEPEHPEIRVRLSSEDMFSIVEITDNGCGIPPEDKKNIFKAFFSSKSLISNGGLGLTYARIIISLHHGDIEVESEIGKFTTFRVVLPINYKARDFYEY